MKQSDQSSDKSMQSVGTSSMVQALSMVSITTGYILGPMAVLGGIGWWIGKQIDSLLPIMIGLILALVLSNILIFKHTPVVLARLQKKYNARDQH